MEYKLKSKKGIDDLKPEYAFQGNSQGDETRTSSIEDYNNSQGWLSFILDCPLTDKDIASRIEENKKHNRQYIDRLKKIGEFGADQMISLNFLDSALDSKKNFNFKSESYKFIIEDMQNKLPPGYSYRPLPHSLTIKNSPIEGLGLYSTLNIEGGIILGKSHALIDGILLRLPLGGFINHSLKPNSKITDSQEGYFYLQTLHSIDTNQEITVNYFQAPCGIKL